MKKKTELLSILAVALFTLIVYACASNAKQRPYVEADKANYEEYIGKTVRKVLYNNGYDGSSNGIIVYFTDGNILEISCHKYRPKIYKQ